jgi:hypothetical protein
MSSTGDDVVDREITGSTVADVGGSISVLKRKGDLWEDHKLDAFATRDVSIGKLSQLIMSKLRDPKSKLDYVMVHIRVPKKAEALWKELSEALDFNDSELMSVQRRMTKYIERGAYRDTTKELYSFRFGTTPCVIISEKLDYFLNFVSVANSHKPISAAIFLQISENSMDTERADVLKMFTEVSVINIKKKKKKGSGVGEDEYVSDITKKVKTMLRVPPTFNAQPKAVLKAIRICKKIFFILLISMTVLTILDVFFKYYAPVRYK